MTFMTLCRLLCLSHMTFVALLHLSHLKFVTLLRILVFYDVFIYFLYCVCRHIMYVCRIVRLLPYEACRILFVFWWEVCRILGFLVWRLWLLSQCPDTVVVGKYWMVARVIYDGCESYIDGCESYIWWLWELHMMVVRVIYDGCKSYIWWLKEL